MGINIRNLRVCLMSIHILYMTHNFEIVDSCKDYCGHLQLKDSELKFQFYSICLQLKQFNSFLVYDWLLFTNKTEFFIYVTYHELRKINKIDISF